jgi:hypothetical protein
MAAAESPVPFLDLVEIMKHAAGALRNHDVPFLLGGGIAIWARGGPETDHDVDFYVKPKDVERALEVLANAGMKPERPPEGWLFKAWEDSVFVDLIFETSEGAVGDDYFERADRLEVHAVRMDVVAVEDVLASKLLALSEQRLDYGSVIEIARALRERIDWEHVRERTVESPYARGFFTLVEELDIAPSGRTV